MITVGQVRYLLSRNILQKRKTDFNSRVTSKINKIYIVTIIGALDLVDPPYYNIVA